MSLERTLAIIKPDAVRAKNAGKIIDHIERAGFDIIALEKKQFTREEAEYFYAVHRERPFFGELVDFMISGPTVVMVLEKEHAIADWRELMGATNPAQAAEGTIRKLFASSIGENAVHGSDSPESANTEISFLFPEISSK